MRLSLCLGFSILKCFLSSQMFLIGGFGTRFDLPPFIQLSFFLFDTRALGRSFRLIRGDAGSSLVRQPVAVAL